MTMSTTSINSTPLVWRISSTRNKDYAPNVQVELMHKLMMKRELKNAIIKVKALDKMVFPDVKLPFPATDELLNTIAWSVPNSHEEHDMASWLNSIAMQIAMHTGVEARRK